MKLITMVTEVVGTQGWPMRRSTANILAAIFCGLLLNCTITGHAQAWDNSLSNPYVAAGYADQCTAFAWGRFKVLNSQALRFVNGQGASVYPGGGLMYDYVVETPSVYRDTTPVRGSLVSWTKVGTPGHAGVAEQVYSDGSLGISEQNWPIGSGPSTKTLSASTILSRSGYTLRGYVNPNRPPAFGTIYTSKIYSTLQVDFALLDEDGRPVNLVFGILNNGQVLPGMAGSGSVTPNRYVSIRFATNPLVAGKSYTFVCYGSDFRGLRSTKTGSFTW